MADSYERSSSQDGGTDELLKYKRWFKEDVQKANKWRKEAREDYEFRDCYQWSDEDKRTLEEQGRPWVTFNRTGVLVDAVVGTESSNRREVRYIPRENGDAIGNELLTSAAEWFRDQCDAEDEESEAFKDVVTAGMGWTETRLDRTDNPEGDPKIERVDPFEMVWDCNADKANLVDSKRRWRVRQMTLEEASKMFPDEPDEALNAGWADPETADSEEHRNDPQYRYSQEVERGPGKKVTIVACQYKEERPYYKTLLIVPPQMQPQMVDLDVDKYKIAMKQGAVIQAVRMKKEEVIQCFLGARMLGKPTPTQTGGFTWNCMTGLKDNKEGIFYGVVRRAKDPQRWLNKWLAQSLHIFNSQAKGGIMAERGAFEDEREAEESWARTDRITWVEDNKLSGQGGPKILPKPMATLPAALDRLIAYADEMIVKATGINMEMLGMREVNQPGVLEYQRKQSGMGILATFFDSLRRYRKIQGRGMLRLIQKYLADGRMVRIVGEDRAQYVPLTKDAVANIEYDIIVDDAPSSPNEKEKTFQILMQLLPVFKDAIGPEQGMILAEYSPLPSSLVEKLKKSVAEAQQAAAQQGPDPVMQMQMAAEQAKNDATMAKAQADVMKSNNDVEIARINAEAERDKAESERVKAHMQREQMLDAAVARENEQNLKLQETAQKSAVEDEKSGRLEQALMSISEQLDALSRRGGGSRRVVRGSDGRATHMESDSGEKISIIRGPDGRLAGFETAVN